MAFEEEEIKVTVGVETRKFMVNNRRRCSKAADCPDGVNYMTAAEFQAHKEEQKRNMEESLRRSQQEAERQSKIDALNAKLQSGDLTLKELNELARLERGL